MSEKETGRLGFLDSLGRLFRAKEEAGSPPPAPASGGGFARLEADFEAAIRALNEKVEESRRKEGPAVQSAGPARKTAEERAAERQSRMEASHLEMREDIGKMHARLGTGTGEAELAAIATFLRDLDSISTEGKDSHALLPRARYAIAERLRRETGELAVGRIVALLERAKLGWPDPTHHRPSATPEEIERSRRRRLAGVREAFQNEGFQRTSERALGIVKGWGGDYPDRGSPLWEECVLEGVAAGIRGQLLKEFVELLRADREALLAETEASIGKQLAALQGALAGGVTSLEQANAAVASSLRVLDEVVPTLAWERIRSKLPQARGEVPA